MIELATVIRDLRGELEQAIAQAEGETLLFALGPVELEVSVALERHGGGGAHVRFWVVDIGADASAGSTSTQRIKLSLTPVGLDGQTPYVSGSPVPNED